MRPLLTLLVIAILGAACAPSPADDASTPTDPAGDGAEPPTDPVGADTTADPGAIAFDVVVPSTEAQPEGAEFGDTVIDVATDSEELTELWGRLGLGGDVPDADTDTQVVIAFTFPGNACAEELVQIVVDDAADPPRLETTWLTEARECADIGLTWVSVVAVHRGDLPEVIEVTRQVRDDVTSATVELGPSDGSGSGGPPPDVPRPLTDAERSALIDASAFRSCEEVPAVTADPQVDGPLSDDPDVAAAQERRAEFALPSDEAAVRDLLAADLDETGWDFPLTESELDELMDRNRIDITEDLANRYLPEHAPDTHGFTVMDQAAGGVVVVGFTDDVEAHADRLSERWGDDIHVIEAAHSQAELESAQIGLHDGDAPDSLVGSGIGNGHLSLTLLDPDPAHLDQLADLVDPDLACVEITSQGIEPLTPEG